MMKSTQLFLKPDEAEFLGMAVAQCLEDIETVSQDPKYPFTPDARKMQKEMLLAGKALKIKLERLGIDVRPLPEYNDGDENEFFTKES